MAQVNTNASRKHNDPRCSPPERHYCGSLVSLVVNAADENLSIEDAPFRLPLDVFESCPVPWAEAKSVLDTREFPMEQPDISVQPESSGLVVTGFILIAGAAANRSVEFVDRSGRFEGFCKFSKGHGRDLSTRLLHLPQACPYHPSTDSAA